MKKNRTVLQAKRLEIYTCTPETKLGEAAEQIVGRDISALVVVDTLGFLEGIITRTDLIRAHLDRNDWAAQPVSAFMRREVVTVAPETLLNEAARLLLNQHIHRVVIVQVEQGRPRPVGVVSASDLVYHMVHDA